MRQIWLVFGYTFKEGIRKKAFWISTVILALLLLFLCMVPRVMDVFRSENHKEPGVETEKKGICYFLDETGIFAEHIQLFQTAAPELNFEVIDPEEKTPSRIESIREGIAEHKENSAVLIGESEGVPRVEVWNNSFMNRGISGETITEVCNLIWKEQILSNAGISEETAEMLQMSVSSTEEMIGEMNITGYILGLVMTFVMFFAVYYYGYGVAMSVASEKTTRVMETLIISAKPSRILIGKCMGMGVLGLLQFTGLLLVGVLGYVLLVPKDFQIAGIDITLGDLSPVILLVLAVYFLMGYAFYAVLNSVCGAAVSKIEDLNSAMMPVSVISILGFYLGYFTSIAGGGSGLLEKLALYLPISAPFTVPFKLLTGSLSNGDLAISGMILLVSIAVVSVVSVKIYSASVMHYGKKLKWKDIMKM